MATLTVEQLRAIDLCKEKLVKRAEKLLEEANVVRLNPNAFGHSQIRNLIVVALETESPSVVTNFIRYQMGRDKKDRTSWSAGDEVALGQRFIDEIEKGVISEALALVPGTKDDETSAQLAKMALLRHFLGFVSRYLRYLDLRRKPNQKRGNR